MSTLHRVHARGAFIWFVLSSLVACSNGRGSLEEQESAQPGAQFTIGGTVSGLNGAGLVIQLNGAGDLSISANGGFTFATALESGAEYEVTVLSEPPGQTCTVENGSGTVADANVTNVAITCSGGTFTVGGEVSGLEGSGLVLRNNGIDDLAISANGPFAFATALETGSTYSVTVATQPSNPSQTCTVSNGSGTIGSADVTGIRVTCETGRFTVGGKVSGLDGDGLVLQNNGGDDLAISRNGPFEFATPLPDAARYNVTVRAQPSGQACTVERPAGTVRGRDITDIEVRCRADRFTIGGTVSGLRGSGLVLRVNGGDDRVITTNGPFAFSTAVASGTSYVVTVRAQPREPTQVCTVSNPAGVVQSANVTNVSVACVTSVFSIGGSVSGLEGSGLVLLNNGGDAMPIASNGTFTFSAEQESGTQYRVTVGMQPSSPAQTCTVENAAGTVGARDVTNVRVRCATSTFSIGGTVTGLLGSGLVLRNSAADELAVNANGPFTFRQELAAGASYDVTIASQPSDPAQACSVSNGSGVVGSADVTSVAISCTTSDFTVGGRVEGLEGSGLILLNNGTDSITLDSNGEFTFPTALPSGAAYSVIIAQQPTGPDQTCVLDNGSGVIGTSNVTNVRVTCTRSEFTVGGRVSGLSGSGLVLQNNGADELPIASNGRFEFPDSLPAGATYSVTVLSQPSDPAQTCDVDHSSGTIGRRDVNDVRVRCRDDGEEND
ncbi:MAG TPA: hypothetical protein VF193_01900 [Steroidobacter sp.]